MAHIILEPYDSLPCEAENFEINGKEACVGEFTEACHYGSCMKGKCCVEHEPISPTKEVLDKYGINEFEFFDIANRIGIELNVQNCGWCS